MSREEKKHKCKKGAIRREILREQAWNGLSQECLKVRLSCFLQGQKVGGHYVKDGRLRLSKNGTT